MKEPLSEAELLKLIEEVNKEIEAAMERGDNPHFQKGKGNTIYDDFTIVPTNTPRLIVKG